MAEKDYSKIINETYTLVKVMDTRLLSMSDNMTEHRSDIAELRKKVHHLDKESVLRSEHNAQLERVRKETSDSFALINERLSNLDVRLWRIIIVVAGISSAVGVGANLGIAKFMGV